jgi:hypothetical protein
MKFWITAKWLGTVFTTEDKEVAEAKYAEWCKIHEYEVILYADLSDGNGAVIWKRH